MSIRSKVRKFFRNSLGYDIRKVNPDAFEGDGVRTVHGHFFLQDPRYKSALARGNQAAGYDYGIHWRLHIALWAGRTAVKLDGDFVECGVNYGVVSSAIMHDLDWSNTGKTFYLFDTFEGQDERYVSDEEKAAGALETNQYFVENKLVATYEGAVKNFAEWSNVSIVKGAVPDTLIEANVERVAFAHIDMNCAQPESDAVAHFWPKLTQGGIMLFDDYCHDNCEVQTRALDEAVAKVGGTIASLPTGQGLLVKT